MKDLHALFRQGLAGLRVLVLMTLLLGLAYPLVVTGVAAVAMPWQAHGSLVDSSGRHVTDADRAVGSARSASSSTLTACSSRVPSAAGDGYDPLSTAGSNLGPRTPTSSRPSRQRRAEVAAREGVAPGAVPPDALTASGSGLDPDISPAYADLQVPRVARANGLTEARVRALVDEHTSGRTLGVLGEPHVNVLELNIDVLRLAGTVLTRDWQDLVMTEERRRGRLTVYLGAAPGVGKTYAMLGEAHRRVARGTDIVVGYVETHGRAQTAAQVEGLEVVPRQEIAYRGTAFTEMDTDAILARKPAVVLVDELAHTNVPGSRHEKRASDVEDLLAAGIDVITTVNIQHLESINDEVERITGVRQRETVPDDVVRTADQIQLVDMSPEALRRRMAHGNIYRAEQIDASLSSYFRVGNLTALRELALLWLADRVDDALDDYRRAHSIEQPWPTKERIVVAVTGGAESETLIRRGGPARATGGRRRAAGGARHRDRRAAQRRRQPGRPVAAARRVPRRDVPRGGRRGRPGGGGRLRHRRQRHHDRGRRLAARPGAPALHRGDRGTDRFDGRRGRRPPRHPRARRGRPRPGACASRR